MYSFIWFVILVILGVSLVISRILDNRHLENEKFKEETNRRLDALEKK